jgi:hypothetical protein
LAWGTVLGGTGAFARPAEQSEARLGPRQAQGKFFGQGFKRICSDQIQGQYDFRLLQNSLAVDDRCNHNLMFLQIDK